MTSTRYLDPNRKVGAVDNPGKQCYFAFFLNTLVISNIKKKQATFSHINPSVKKIWLIIVWVSESQ